MLWHHVHMRKGKHTHTIIAEKKVSYSLFSLPFLSHSKQEKPNYTRPCQKVIETTFQDKA
jgi:hypothetical protein